MTFAARDTRPLQGVSVLIVEDHADSREAMHLMVERLGARVLVGPDARQAVATLEGTPVDVVLCDLRMPDTDGFELNARIRHDPRWHHIPVIAMTGLDSQADYHRTLEAGFAGHLAKPIDIEVLCSTICSILSVPAPLRPRALIVEDAGPVRDLLRDALGHAGFEVDTAATATEALDRLATRRYAVIVADRTLPDLPALDWLAALRGAALATPLILQSGRIGPGELAGYAAELGAVAVLEKPFSVGRLVEVVRGAVGLK